MSSEPSSLKTSNNPHGHNQHSECPSRDDETVASLLQEFHRTGITNAKIISELLLSKHSIKMSERTVKSRKKDLNLLGSGAQTKAMAAVERRQMVFDIMANDPMGNLGPRSVREKILQQTGVHLTREGIDQDMRLQNPAGFDHRNPNNQHRVHRVALVSLGPNHEWSGDGHDKLTAYGWPIWGIRDKFSGKWLGLWVVPNNRLKLAVAYLWLSLVRDLEGMPYQVTTDCGSETTAIFGIANMLR